MAATAASKKDHSSDKAQIKLRLRLPLIWLGVLLVAAFFLPDRVWNTLLIGIGGLFIVAYVWVWQLAKGLRAERRLRFGWVAVGDHLQEEFALFNAAELPALWVEIKDASNVPGYSAAIVQSMGAHQNGAWRKTAVCIQRGQFTLGPWAIRSGDPFGIFQVTRHYPVSHEIIIHPPIHGHLPISLPAGQSNGRVRARQRALQVTINAASVRNYLPNDPMNRIHWPTSAAKENCLFANLISTRQATSGFCWICKRPFSLAKMRIAQKNMRFCWLLHWPPVQFAKIDQSASSPTANNHRYCHRGKVKGNCGKFYAHWHLCMPMA